MRRKSNTNVKVTLSYGQASLTVEVNRRDNYYPMIEQTSRYPSIDYSRENYLPYHDNDYDSEKYCYPDDYNYPY